MRPARDGSDERASGGGRGVSWGKRFLAGCDENCVRETLRPMLSVRDEKSMDPRLEHGGPVPRLIAALIRGADGDVDAVQLSPGRME